MKKHLFVCLGVLIVAFLAGAEVPPQSGDKAKPAQAAAKPIVAPMLDADGMELVITPLAEKLAPLGLEPEDLHILEGYRFVTDDWKVKIKDKEIQLDKVARLELRKLAGAAVYRRLAGWTPGRHYSQGRPHRPLSRAGSLFRRGGA